ncbi:hypothetical protein YC2023_030233 [Brassica napus]
MFYYFPHDFRSLQGENPGRSPGKISSIIKRRKSSYKHKTQKIKHNGLTLVQTSNRPKRDLISKNVRRDTHVTPNKDVSKISTAKHDTRQKDNHVGDWTANKISIQTVKIIHSTFIHHYPLISDHRKASIEQIEISSVTSSHQNMKSSRVTTQESIDRTAINERIVRRGNRAGEKNVREVIFFRKLSRRSLKIQSFSESNLKKDESFISSPRGEREILILDDHTMKRVGPSPCKAAAAVNLVSHTMNIKLYRTVEMHVKTTKNPDINLVNRELTSHASFTRAGPNTLLSTVQ